MLPLCQNVITGFFLPDLNGVDLNAGQDTAVATHKEDTYIHFCVDVEIQKHVEKLPQGQNNSFPFGSVVLFTLREAPTLLCVIHTAHTHTFYYCISR